MTAIENAPPSHALTIIVALIFDAIVLYGAVFTWLTIRASRHTCDRGEDA
jgi:hypothetical protein